MRQHIFWLTLAFLILSLLNLFNVASTAVVWLEWWFRVMLVGVLCREFVI